MKLFEAFVSTACNRNISVRVFTNPRHALAEHMLFENGHWPLLEYWKVQLATIATRYHTNCDFKIFDFSGYNSITNEPIVTLTPTSGLINYWEASHYKGKVGEIILKRLFSLQVASLPPDFGLELRDDTVQALNSNIRRNQSVFSRSQAREILQANEWVQLGRKQ